MITNFHYINNETNTMNMANEAAKNVQSTPTAMKLENTRHRLTTAKNVEMVQSRLELVKKVSTSAKKRLTSVYKMTHPLQDKSRSMISVQTVQLANMVRVVDNVFCVQQDLHNHKKVN